MGDRNEELLNNGADVCTTDKEHENRRVDNVFLPVGRPAELVDCGGLLGIVAIYSLRPGKAPSGLGPFI